MVSDSGIGNELKIVANAIELKGKASSDIRFVMSLCVYACVCACGPGRVFMFLAGQTEGGRASNECVAHIDFCA